MIKPKPGEPAMLITLDIDGNFVKATYPDGKREAVPTSIPDGVFKEVKLQAYAVLAYTTNPQRCVTYQTPSGPRTV